MSKAPCCWSTNELSRDKKDYMRCSTRQDPAPCGDDKKGAGKDRDKDKNKKVCCSTAFRMQMAKEAADAETEELQCGPSKGKKAKAMRPYHRCFSANMVCMKLYMPGRDFSCPEKLRIKANVCRGCKPIMCANRINVNYLPREPIAKFSMLPECLERELNDGISLSVVYQNKEIGRGCFVPPESVILRMTNTLQEVVYTANVELTCNGCTVGTCTIRFSMLMQCQPLDVSDVRDNDEDEEVDTCGDMMGVNTQSEGTTSTDPCLGFQSVEDPSFDSSCIQESSNNTINRKKAGSEGGKKLIDMAGPYSVYGYDNTNNTGCLEISSAHGPGGQFSFTSHLGSGNTNRMCPQISAPKLKQLGMKRGRECPVCHEDVSWLPQISACPQCGYKPLPEFVEKEYDEQATAKDILVDFFDTLVTDASSPDPASASVGPPICDQPTEGQASEGFDTIVQDYKALKQSIRKCKSAQICPEGAAQKAKPPNLLSVFTELKNLFQSGESDSAKKVRIKEICDEACKLSKATRRRNDHKNALKGGSSCGVLKMRKRHQKAHKIFVKSRVYTPVDQLDHRKHGHIHCREDEHKVPAHMGWLWTQSPMAQRPGWRPGAIRRSIRELMSYFLKDFPVDSIPISKYMSYHRQKPRPEIDEEEKPEDLVQVPTLHIEKKNDEYLITLRPLKDADTLHRAANPYANMKPVQFRIVKNPLLKQEREMKRCLKNMGFSKCKCHKPVMECYCRSFIDKKQLVDEVKRQCIKRQMQSCENDLILSDTTDSEAEFDFGVTPPAGLMHPERLKVASITHAGTQYNENDWAMPAMYPHPPNAHVQYSGCVVGERQGKFNWIFGKGFVHRKPKPPKMRNPPKKKPKRAFPGAPLPREKGGAATETDTPDEHKFFKKRDCQITPSPHIDRLQRLNRASQPPSALQFQRSGEHGTKAVRFDISQNENFII